MRTAPDPSRAASVPQTIDQRPRLTRPRDAATLLVVDDVEPRAPRLLLGRRAPGHIFMAGKYVFPGGRIDKADLRLAAAFRLTPGVLERLMAGTTARFDETRATALALAAVRETFEEAGAMIGVPDGGDPVRSRAGIWGDFAAAGVRPDLSRLVPFARAITPPGPARRYDTRFFCVSARDIVQSLPFGKRPDKEFDRLGWYGLTEIAGLDLAGITRQVLGDFEHRLKEGSWREPGPSMPFYLTRHGRFVRESI